MKNLKKNSALLMSIIMVASITGCDLPFGGNSEGGKKSKADKEVEEAVASYMDFVVAGKYDKAVKLVSEEGEISIATMFDYLSDDQTDALEAIIATTEYEVSDISVDDDEATCKVNITVVDVESVIDDLDDAWDIDDLIDAIKDSDDTTSKKIKISLVNDDEWLLESDEDIANYYYDLVEDIGVGAGSTDIPVVAPVEAEGDFTEDAVIAYIDNCFNAMASGNFEELLDEGETMDDVFGGISENINDPAKFTTFVSTYFTQVTHTTTVNSIDAENKIANVTVNTQVPAAADLVLSVYNNHDFLVKMFAYAIVGKDFNEDPTLMAEFFDIMTASIATSNKESLSATTTVTMDENGKFDCGDEIKDCLFGDTSSASQPELSDEETMQIFAEAITYALENGLITEEEFEQLVSGMAGNQGSEDPEGTPTTDVQTVDVNGYPVPDEEIDELLSVYKGDDLYYVYYVTSDDNKILTIYFETWDFYDTGKQFICVIDAPDVNPDDAIVTIINDVDSNDLFEINYETANGLQSGVTYKFYLIDPDNAEESILGVVYYTAE